MKTIPVSSPVIHALMAMFIVCLGRPVAADVRAECQQEAEDYEVMPELRADYINGCIESRGGVSMPAGTEADPAPPSGPDDPATPESDGEYRAE